jgi:glycosyltransferase involved in cell wall biosynthesis
MKISIITVVLNAESFIEHCIRSVISQSYSQVEYIIIDGGSTDSSLSIIRQFAGQIHIIRSEKDKGIYDAMNKGIALATGDVVGILNADDFFADEHVLAEVAAAFKNNDTDMVYGDLWFVDRVDSSRAVRKWISKPFDKVAMAWGWMPAHPTFYARRKMFNNYGFYNLKFNSSADYELMLRFMYLNKTKSFYLDRVLVKMRVGGMSNRSVYNRLRASFNDWKAMRRNGIPFAWLKIFIKPLRKINQYLIS